MELTGVIYSGPDIDEIELLDELPNSLGHLLKTINGFVQFNGGLHIRGICFQPDWHSIQHVWFGKYAFHVLYDAITKEDIPFAQDCVGDQFFLRESEVIRLSAEVGSVEKLGVEFATFLKMANAKPVEYLALEPLLQLHNEGHTLVPGQLIHVFPPFCTKESGGGVSLKAVPIAELLDFHANFAAQLPKDGTKIKINIV